MTVKRIWHGWTTPENAAAYQALLLTEIFPGIERKRIAGYRGIELLRRPAGAEVEFVTVMSFESLDSVIAFQGPDYARSYVPDAARKVLKRWDAMAEHYEVIETRCYR